MLLCVDTSSPLGSMCLSKGGQIHEVLWEKKSSHSEVITTTFAKLQTQHGFSPEELTHLAVDVGPGSFTGIRVGLSFIKALAYSFNLPTVCFHSFEIVAHAHAPNGKTLFTLPAARGYFYVAGYENRDGKLSELLSPTSKNESEVKQLISDYGRVIDMNQDLFRPKASKMAELFGQKANVLKYVSWKDIYPLYLRRSEAEEKLEAGLLKPVYKK